MNKINQALKRISINPKVFSWLGIVFSFLSVFIYFAWLNAAPVFSDPDSFYHAKMSLLLAEASLPFKSFPWLPLTNFSRYFTDHNFLYHLILIPFVKLMNPLVAIKLATVVLASLFVTVFYLFFRSVQAPFNWLFGSLIFAMPAYVFRLSLAKASAVSFTFVLMIIWLLHQLVQVESRSVAKKVQRTEGKSLFFLTYWHFLLFVISFLYVWFHGSWPLSLLVISCWGLINLSLLFLGKHLAGSKRTIAQDLLITRRQFSQREFSRQVVWPVLMVFSGSLLGLVVNPYFPNNLNFYWLQSIKFIFGQAAAVGAGSEWYGYKFLEFLSVNYLLVFLLVISWLVFFLTWRRQTRITYLLFILSSLFLLTVFQARRSVEFLVPLSVMFSACVWRDALVWLKSLKTKFQSFLNRQQWRKLVITSLSLGLFLSFTNSAVQTKQALSKGFAFDLFQKESQWLAAEAPAAIVFHSDWDEFPMLFYHNTTSYYIVGLDPRFFSTAEPILFQLWRQITLGRKKEALYPLISETFQAQYILVDKNHQLMRANIEATPGFRKVFSGRDAWLYKVE